MMIICKNADEIRKVLWEIVGGHRYKRDKGIQVKFDMADVDAHTMYRYTAGICDTRTDSLCKMLAVFGYQLAIVKVGDDNEHLSES